MLYWVKKKMDYLFKLEMGKVCNPMENDCLQAMKIVHHQVNELFDWLICVHQSFEPSREIISVLSEKDKRFTLIVHSVLRQD